MGLVIASLAGGILVSLVGYYTPFLIVSSAVSAVGAGLLSMLHPSSTLAQILGFQVVLSVGLGLGAQNIMVIPGVIFSSNDVVMAIATICFVQTLASAVSVTIGQSVFHNRLVENLRVSAPSADRSLVEEGATLLRENIPPDLLPSVLGAYSRAVSQTFYAGVAMCALSFFGCLVLQWKRVPDQKPEAPEEKTSDTVPLKPVPGEEEGK